MGTIFHSVAIQADNAVTILESIIRRLMILTDTGSAFIGLIRQYRRFGRKYPVS